jgi:hypothetical protein
MQQPRSALTKAASNRRMQLYAQPTTWGRVSGTTYQRRPSWVTCSNREGKLQGGAVSRDARRPPVVAETSGCRTHGGRGCAGTVVAVGIYEMRAPRLQRLVLRMPQPSANGVTLRGVVAHCGIASLCTASRSPSGADTPARHLSQRVTVECVYAGSAGSSSAPCAHPSGRHNRRAPGGTDARPERSCSSGPPRCSGAVTRGAGDATD